MRSLLRRNAFPWTQGRTPGLLLLVYAGLACGQVEPQVEFQVGPQNECQELIRRASTKRLQEGTLAQSTGWSQMGAFEEDTGWSLVTGMRTARYNHTATLLGSGKVLITGGSAQEGVWLKSTELYQPTSERWRETKDSLITPRDNHMATLLLSGKVLVAGGYNNDKKELTSAEMYDPATETWTDTTPMHASRSSATMTCLPSNKVLVTGGYGSDHPDNPSIKRGPLMSAEIYDPETGQWTLTNSMSAARYFHTATLLPSGKVLIVGGCNSECPDDPLIAQGSPLASAEVYDPELGTWSHTNSMNTARYLHTVTRLPSGKILVAGGSNSLQVFIAEAEEYDPRTNEWTTIEKRMSPRNQPTATLLPSGKVLVSGGKGDKGSYLISAEEYDPSSRSWTNLDEMDAPRFGHTATLLLSGKVLLAGGKSDKPITNEEVYDEVPAAPQVTNPTQGDQFVDTWILDIAGTAEPNSTVMVSLDEARPVPVLVDADGSWSHTLPEPLTLGTHTLSTRAIDLSGNGSKPASVTFEMVAESHYGWSCSSTSAFPTIGISLVVLGALLSGGRRAYPYRELAPKHWAATRARLVAAERDTEVGELTIPPLLASAAEEQGAPR